NHAQAYEHTDMEYRQFQEHPQFKEELPMSYKLCLANLIGKSHSVKNTERFLELIEELKDLPVSSFNEEGEVFQNIYFSEHLHYINTGEFDKAEALVPAIEKGLITYRNKINKARVLTFQYNIMIMYFLMHRFKDALLWTNVILEDKSEIKEGVKDVSRILLPIIHFELGHHDLVENLTRSAYRYLLKKKKIHRFEKMLINYLREMPLSTDRDEFKTSLENFKDQLVQLTEDPNEAMAYGMEEMGLWVKSRLTGRQMSELILDL
ncbi:MAG: hypothetical protein JKX84_05825, partial [Flavobacteriales bacterium]|nr:hypothetical protein [Flavobacteriales bacterium]